MWSKDMDLKKDRKTDRRSRNMDMKDNGEWLTGDDAERENTK